MGGPSGELPIGRKKEWLAESKEEAENYETVKSRCRIPKDRFEERPTVLNRLQKLVYSLIPFLRWLHHPEKLNHVQCALLNTAAKLAVHSGKTAIQNGYKLRGIITNYGI